MCVHCDVQNVLKLALRTTGLSETADSGHGLWKTTGVRGAPSTSCANGSFYLPVDKKTQVY